MLVHRPAAGQDRDLPRLIEANAAAEEQVRRVAGAGGQPGAGAAGEGKGAQAFEKEVDGSKKAELEYTLIASSDRYHLLEINPLTGRHHQIRVQLSTMGCPIKGDLKYGFPRSNDNASIHLHSRKTEFVHPVSKNNIELIAPPPKDVLWDWFVQKIG